MSHLCTAVGGQLFHKESKKLWTKIVFEHCYSFFHYCLLLRDAPKSILSKSKWWIQAVVRGARPLWPSLKQRHGIQVYN